MAQHLGSLLCDELFCFLQQYHSGVVEDVAWQLDHDYLFGSLLEMTSDCTRLMPILWREDVFQIRWSPMNEMLGSRSLRMGSERSRVDEQLGQGRNRKPWR